LGGAFGDTDPIGERRTKMDFDIVVFRRWKDSGDVIALFPEIPADLFGRYCDAYEHVGQHGGADYWGVLQATVPVQPEDSADLAEELTRIGYNLRPIRRGSWRHHEKRRQAAREIALV
jgi:hypothetical protein